MATNITPNISFTSPSDIESIYSSRQQSFKEKSLLDPNVVYTLPTNVINKLNSWDLEIFELSHQQLSILATKIIEYYNILEIYQISYEKWYRFLSYVEVYMSIEDKSNPYHNFRHVIDVLHACHCLLTVYEAKYYLQPIDIFVVLISCLVHDLGHPGLNNTYQMNALTPLAIRYNDNSILENHHSALAFDLFYNPKYQCNLLDSLDKEQAKYARKAIIKAILGTDMVHHFALKGEYETTIATKFTSLSMLFPTINNTNSNNQHSPNSGHNGSFAESSLQHQGSVRKIIPSITAANRRLSGGSETASKRPSATSISINSPLRKSIASEITFTEKERLLWISLLLHTADISNPAKIYSISRQWSEYVTQEFFYQGDKEKNENLPVSMNCDRTTSYNDEVALNFSDFIVTPLFITLTKSLPKLRFIVKILQDNRNILHEILIQRLTHGNENPENNSNDEIINKWKLRQEQAKELFASISLNDNDE